MVPSRDYALLKACKCKTRLNLGSIYSQQQSVMQNSFQIKSSVNINLFLYASGKVIKPLCNVKTISFYFRLAAVCSARSWMVITLAAFVSQLARL